jgi:hypothetical protein
VNGSLVNTYLAGMVSAGFLACGLFFAKFWWRSRDVLFMAFTGAFWLLALNAALVVLMPEPDERRTWFYLLRIAAYLLIVVAIVRKNAVDPGDD